MSGYGYTSHLLMFWLRGIYYRGNQCQVVLPGLEAGKEALLEGGSCARTAQLFFIFPHTDREILCSSVNADLVREFHPLWSVNMKRVYKSCAQKRNEKKKKLVYVNNISKNFSASLNKKSGSCIDLLHDEGLDTDSGTLEYSYFHFNMRVIQ